MKGDFLSYVQDYQKSLKVKVKRLDPSKSFKDETKPEKTILMRNMKGNFLHYERKNERPDEVL